MSYCKIIYDIIAYSLNIVVYLVRNERVRVTSKAATMNIIQIDNGRKPSR